MKSCAVIPQIKGKDGNVKDSKLFKDLLSFTNNNREQTNRLYYITKNPKFQSDYSDILKYDDLGEVTMNSLLKLDLSSMLEESNLKRKISESYGFFEKGAPLVLDDTTENYNSLVEKAISFNTDAEGLLGTLTRTSDIIEQANDMLFDNSQKVKYASFWFHKDNVINDISSIIINAF